MKRIPLIVFLAAALTQCGTDNDAGRDATDVFDTLDIVETLDAEQDTVDETGDTGNDLCPDTDDSGQSTDQGEIDTTDADVPPDVAELPIYNEPESTVLFNLLGAQADSPFPSNHYTDRDTGTLKIGADGYNNTALYLIEMDVPSYARDAALMQGFALYSALSFMTSTEVDVSSIPATGADSMLPESSVKLYELGGDEPEPRKIWCAFKRFEESRVFNMTQCFPLYKMKPDTTYALVITDDLKDTQGDSFARSLGFTQALRLARIEGEPDADRLDLMYATGDEIAQTLTVLPDADKIVGASVFTTGHPQTVIEDVLKTFRQGENKWDVTFTLDSDAQENPIVYQGSNFPGCSLANEYMEWGLRGYFRAPEFRNADGHFERDTETGEFKTFESEDIRFALMVPEGNGPFPVVIAQHGVSSSEGAMCHIGRELVRRDIAVLRFLWPEHGGSGERGNGTTDFLDVLNPARIGYNFAQSATEIASAVMLLDKINQEMAESHPEGDALPPLDTSRIGYVGTSLGSIIGLLYLPFSDRINVMVSNVGGLGMSHLVKRFIDEYFGGIFIGSAVTNLADHIVAPGDGVSNIEKLLTAPVEWASGPKYLLAQEVIGDVVVANECTEVLAQNAGLKQINPVAVEIEGLDAVDPADATSGLFQYTGTDHHQFTDSTPEPIPATEQLQAWHYLETGLTVGTPEIKVFEPEI